MRTQIWALCNFIFLLDFLCVFGDPGRASSLFGDLVPLADGKAQESILIKQSNILKKKKRRICRMSEGVGESLADALHYSRSACKNLFKYERWNCSLDTSNNNVLYDSFRETSFVYAISSAGLVHSFARACSTGRLARCTCDVSFNAVENRRTWAWGGCGDNFDFGVKFTRKCVLQPHQKDSIDLISLVHRHNSEVGIRTIKEGLTKVCKCHGVSGSCTSKTCWKQLSPFSYTSRNLKQRYDDAVKAQGRNDGSMRRAFRARSRHRRKKSGKRRKNRNRNHENRIPIRGAASSSSARWRRRRRSRAILPSHSSRALLYLSDSPDFCNYSNFSSGTSGRECVRGENCRTMCCGRGHNVQVKVVKSSCRCRVVWCCHVHCQVCVSKKEVYSCK